MAGVLRKYFTDGCARWSFVGVGVFEKFKAGRFVLVGVSGKDIL